MADLHDISTPLARHRAAQTAPCPQCGAKTIRYHVRFDRERFPELPRHAWLNSCKCGWEGQLTGNPEQDRNAKDFWKDKR